MPGALTQHKTQISDERKMNINAYFDGACEPRNPGGNMGLGACIIDADSGEIMFEYSRFIAAHQSNSNNVAEYMALIKLLEWFIENGYDKPGDHSITIHGDSMLAIEQMKGKWRMKGGRYIEHAQRAKVLTMQFSKQPTFKWIPRHQNQTADDLSKREMIKNNVTFKIQQP